MFVCKTGDGHVHINMSIICGIYRSSIVIWGVRIGLLESGVKTRT